MAKPPNPVEDDRFLAGVDLLRRSGMHSFQIRYSDDEEPVVWLAVGEWKLDARGHPVPEGQHAGTYFDAMAAMNPLGAVLRLCEKAIDGGTCVHCGKPSAVSDDWASEQPLDEYFCYYVFDPELKTFRRSCEGT
jgi:hypothetical protein